MLPPKHVLMGMLALTLLLSSCATQKKQVSFSDLKYPKREFRGAWINTAWQSRYKNMNPEQMKAYFVKTLDQLQADGINAVVFQVRPQADAFYKSKYEPWSASLTGMQGVAPADGFDPLATIVDECHKRNMELHAWLNPYRVTTFAKDSLAANHLYHREPNRFVTYEGKIYFDPGIPENRKFICDVVEDILLNYDVDAIHMDDYFYPYPAANGERFPDENSFEKYGLTKGYTADQLNDWRRNNVNTLIQEIKSTMLTTKPWVRFGISPFGIYRNKKSTLDGSGSQTNGLQNYDDLFADVKLWVEKGWIDYNAPQIYWEIGHKSADYKTLVEWWSKNNYEQPLYIGQDVKRTMDATTPTGDTQLSEKMMLSRSYPTIHGNIFWSAYPVLDNYKDIENDLRTDFHKYPALIPAYTHMHNKKPQAVKNLKEQYSASTHTLSWTAQSDRFRPELAQYYVVYRFAKGEKENLENPQYIVAITRETSYVLPYQGGEAEYKYVVTAVDGFHNESKGKSKKVKL